MTLPTAFAEKSYAPRAVPGSSTIPDALAEKELESEPLA